MNSLKYKLASWWLENPVVDRFRRFIYKQAGAFGE